MPYTSLFRIEPLAAQNTTALAEQILMRHLRFAPLTSILAKIAGRQRSYLATTGCRACTRNRCRPGCHAALLQRGLRAARLAELVPVTRGLAQRPYARLTLGWPSRQALPLSDALLEPWNEARLHLTWRARRHGVGAAALLLSDTTPDPVVILRAAGWYAFALPLKSIRIVHGHSALGWLPWLAATSPLTPSLLGLSTPQPQSPAPTATAEPSISSGPFAVDLLERETLAIRELCQTDPGTLARTTASPLTPAATPEAWPEARIAALVALLVTHPKLTNGAQQSQIGLTIGRLATHLALPRRDAEQLLVWLDQCGLLADVANPELRWRQPRRLVTLDAPTILAGLVATPAPSFEYVAAALAPSP